MVLHAHALRSTYYQLSADMCTENSCIKGGVGTNSYRPALEHDAANKWQNKFGTLISLKIHATGHLGSKLFVRCCVIAEKLLCVNAMTISDCWAYI